jgi:four helix bundle protein
MKSENLILNLTFDFAFDIITYTELLEEKRKFVLANQLQKSGVSIGLNTSEAQDAESRAEFIHKLKISLKEVNEAGFILKLCKKHPSYPDPGDLQDRLETVKKILGKIVATSNKNNTKKLNRRLKNPDATDE